MKKIILLGFVILGTSAIAQEVKEKKGSTFGEIKKEQEHVEHVAEKEREKGTFAGAKEVKQEAAKKENHPKPETHKENNGNAYGKDKGEMTGREFGHERSEAAKHKEKPKTSDEAKSQIKESKEWSREEIDRAQNNINVYNEKIEAMKKEGKITQAEYDAQKQKVESLIKRKKELESKLNSIGE